ncbi:MAG: SGNH/GDSL hydrolase family protein [Gammaproteobacteria bacterium]
MKLPRLLRAACCAALMFPLSALALPFSSLVVFGDSLVDNGNVALGIDSGGFPPVLPGTRQPTPLPSNGAIPGLPYAGTDNFSNGPAWAQQFAAMTGLPLTPALAGGTNFAFGGARTGSPSPTPSLRDQVDFYTLFFPPSAADTLFILNGGGNDLRRVFEGTSAATIVSEFVTNTGTMIGQLFAHGARQFLVSTVPDVGKTPFAAAADALVPGSAAGATALALAMNDALKAMIAGLDPAIRAGIDLLDLFAFQQALHADPAAFGFDDVTTGCASSLACIADPLGTFYWDGIHPTAAGHRVIARAAYAITVPEPGTVTLLGIALVALSSRRTWQRSANLRG